MSEKYLNVYNLIKTFGELSIRGHLNESFKSNHGNIKLITYSEHGVDIVVYNCYFIVHCGIYEYENGDFVSNPNTNNSIDIDKFDYNHISPNEVKKLIIFLLEKEQLDNFLELINKCIVDMI